MNKENKQIKIQNMCEKHKSLLIHQARYSEKEPWQVLIIAAQITLFQAATADSKTHTKVGGDISKVEKLGCLACYKPDIFGEIVEVAKSKNIGDIKALGDRIVKAAQKEKTN